MRTNHMGLLLTAVLILSAATPVCAAPGFGRQGSGGWGMGGSYQRTYNPATVETVTGEVVAVDPITPMRGMGAGVHLQLRSGKETVSVHLGPAWFIERLDARIDKGDTIEVKGSRVTMGGKPTIIAAEVRKGEQSLKLRDENGIPVWAGWRR